MTARRTDRSRSLTALAAALTMTVVASCSQTSGQGNASGEAATPKASSASTSSSSASKSSQPSTASASTSAGSDDAQQGKHPGLPTDAELAQAKRDVSKLSTRQLAGQVLVGEFTGKDPAAVSAAIEKDNLGGVIVMGDNVPADVKSGMPAMARAAHASVKRTGRDWPAIIGVDQEGGPVQRLTSPVMQLPGGMAFGAANSPQVATETTQALGQELRALGFTMVMAPDADVTVGPSDPTIGVRSPGSDPQRVASAVSAQVKGFQQSGIVPVVKHFPGHGSVTSDTHVDVAHQKHDVDWLMKRDWVPFAKAASAGAPALMTAHIVVDKVDPNVPGTLSPKVLTDTVRKKLGFHGLIVTDGMGMGAIVKRYDQGGAAAVSALKAGADVILMPANPSQAVTAIEKAVKSGDLTRERLIESAARIVATARHQAASTPDISTVGSHESQAQKLAQASVTQLGGSCGKPLTGRQVQLDGGTPAQRATLTKELAAQGITVGSSGQRISLLRGAIYNAGKATAGGGSQASKRGAAGAAATDADVLVALDTPYVLENRGPKAVGLAAYGATDATLRQVAMVIAGKAKASGTLPVAVGKEGIGTGACSAR